MKGSLKLSKGFVLMNHKSGLRLRLQRWIRVCDADGLAVLRLPGKPLLLFPSGRPDHIRLFIEGVLSALLLSVSLLPTNTLKFYQLGV